MTMEPRPGDIVTIEGKTSADNDFERNGGIVFRNGYW